MKNLDIKNFETSCLKDPKFIKPLFIRYNQNGVEKTWESVRSFDSVSVLLYHKQYEAYLVVKQFRPPVYMTDDKFKYTYELCAGILDKPKPIVQIAREEIYEECGYDVPVEDIHKVNIFFSNVGVSGSRQHIYTAVIDESMKKHSGGGIGDESIELEFIPKQTAVQFVFDETKAKTSGLMFAFYWHMTQIDKQKEKIYE